MFICFIFFLWINEIDNVIIYLDLKWDIQYSWIISPDLFLLSAATPSKAKKKYAESDEEFVDDFDDDYVEEKKKPKKRGTYIKLLLLTKCKFRFSFAYL